MGKPTFDLCNSENGEFEIARAGTTAMGMDSLHKWSGNGLAFLLDGFWTCRDQKKVFVPEYIGYKGEPGELKHLSTRRKGHQRDSVSSGERTRTRPVV